MNGTRKATREDRFWAKVTVLSNEECWPWTGYVARNGYGSYWDGNRPTLVHRQSYEFAHGRAAVGVVDHTCHNESGCPGGHDCPHRSCVNPSHLEDVTHQTNMRRGQTGKRKARRTECVNGGHQMTPENTFTTKSGDRLCRACKRMRETNRRNKLRGK